MATVIDSLIVELGLDPKKFTQGQKESVDSLRKLDEASEKSNKKNVEGAKKLAEGFNKAKNELAGLVAIAVGFSGMKEFISTMVQGNAALGRTAYYTGMSARELDAWDAAVKSAGGTAEGFENSVKGIQGAFEALRYGQGDAKVAGIFKSFGIAFADANGKARPIKDVLLDLAAVFNKLKPQDQLYLGKQLGLDEGTLNLLRQGRDAVKGVYDQMYAASGVTEENIAAATRLQQKWALFKQTMDGIAQGLFGNVSPALELILDDLTKLANEFKTIDKETGGWLSTLVALGSALIGIKATLGTISALKNLVTGGGATAAATEGGAAAAKGGIIARFFPFLSRILGPAWLALHSGDLNQGEKEELAKIHAKEAEYAASGTTPYDSPSSGTKSTGTSRGIRNNNPGNIEYGKFAQSQGATGSDGRFAIFPTIDAGINAMMVLLKSYKNKGINTISGIVSRYAPSSENNTAAYIAAVVKKTGIGAGQHLTDDQYSAVQSAMAIHESGYRGMAGAGVNQSARSNGNTQIETKINTINVQTQATDANGVAKGMHQAIQDNIATYSNVSALA